MDFWRQLAILSPDDTKNTKLTVIGAGGIGSPTVLALAKMGVKYIAVYDHDTIEAHNLPNQFYRLKDIGTSKVEALASIVNEYSDIIIAENAEKYEEQEAEGIVISGVDSMAVRKKIWEKMKYNIKVPFYIDARMGAEVARIHTVRTSDPDDVKWYESTLYTDEEASEAPCSARSIIYCTFMIAALIANQTKKLIKMQPYKKEIIFDLVTMTLLTIDGGG